jgi:ferritin
MEFKEQIQQWVTIDNQLKIIGERMKELRDKKNEITDKINAHVEIAELSNSVVKINDGQLKFIKVKETQPLTFKYLETCLSEIIKNEEQVKKIIEYVKNKREITFVSEIKRSYNN